MKKEASNSNPVAVMCLFALLTLLVNLLFCALYAALVTFSGLTDAYVSAVSTVICVITVFAAGFSTAHAARKRGLLWGAAAGLLSGLLVLLIGYFSDGDWVFGSQHIVRLAVTVVSGGVGGILGVNR